MRKVYHKYFFPWGEDKEKLFLEEMARDGHKLIEVGFGKYVFEKGEPRDLIYQFDFKGIKQDDLDEYLQIHEDAGWEAVATYGKWYYFCKEREGSRKDELFSDNASIREKYKRLLLFLLFIGAPLYYNVFVVFPHIVTPNTDIGLLNGFKILILLIACIHLLILFKVYRLYMRYQSKIKE